MKKETVEECFTIVKCPECDSQKVKTTDFDEYNKVLRFKCKKCGMEFTKSIG